MRKWKNFLLPKLKTPPCNNKYITTLMTMKFLSQMTPIRTVPKHFITILVILIISIFKCYHLEMTLIYPLRYIYTFLYEPDSLIPHRGFTYGNERKQRNFLIRKVTKKNFIELTQIIYRSAKRPNYQIWITSLWHYSNYCSICRFFFQWAQLSIAKIIRTHVPIL